MNQIVPGIRQLKVPIPNNPLGHTNVYLLGNGDGYVLIDAGFPGQEAFEAMQKELAEAGVSMQKITKMVITHGHGDHIGLAGQIKEISGAAIAIHRLEARQQHVPQPPTPREFAKMNAEWFRASGMPDGPVPEMPHHHGPGNRPFAPPPEPDILLEDKDEVSIDAFALRVIWTPGHSPGLICLFDAQRRVLFSADHVLPVTTPNIGLRPGMNGQTGSNPLGDYLRSLAKVGDLDVETVLPAHEQVFHDLRGRVDEILEHHRRRNEEITAVLRQGGKTAYQVAELITWMPESGGVTFHKLAHWDQRMAVSETIAHLQALREAGVVLRYARGGIVYYALKTG